MKNSEALAGISCELSIRRISKVYIPKSTLLQGRAGQANSTALARTHS